MPCLVLAIVVTFVVIVGTGMLLAWLHPPDASSARLAMMHPQQSPPTLRCLPDLVHGMPVARLIRDLAAEIPRSRFQLNPP